jgi:hypothetical protein
LLFLVLRRLTTTAWIAAAGALLWALHPLRVESFAWVALAQGCALHPLLHRGHPRLSALR